MKFQRVEEGMGFILLLIILTIVALIVGVRVAGASEVTGTLPAILYVDEMPKGFEMAVGLTNFYKDGRTEVFIQNSLPAWLQQLVLTHELCHVVLGPYQDPIEGENICWDITYKMAETIIPKN